MLIFQYISGDKDDESSSSEPEEEDSIPTKSNPEPSSFAVKDWNEEFQQLLQYEDNFDKFVELGKLAQEFGKIVGFTLLFTHAHHYL